MDYFGTGMEKDSVEVYRGVHLVVHSAGVAPVLELDDSFDVEKMHLRSGSGMEDVGMELG